MGNFCSVMLGKTHLHVPTLSEIQDVNRMTRSPEKITRDCGMSTTTHVAVMIVKKIASGSLTLRPVDNIFLHGGTAGGQVQSGHQPNGVSLVELNVAGKIGGTLLMECLEGKRVWGKYSANQADEAKQADDANCIRVHGRPKITEAIAVLLREKYEVICVDVKCDAMTVVLSRGTTAQTYGLCSTKQNARAKSILRSHVDHFIRMLDLEVVSDYTAAVAIVRGRPIGMRVMLADGELGKTVREVLAVVHPQKKFTCMYEDETAVLTWVGR